MILTFSTAWNAHTKFKTTIQSRLEVLSNERQDCLWNYRETNSIERVGDLFNLMTTLIFINEEADTFLDVPSRCCSTFGPKQKNLNSRTKCFFGLGDMIRVGAIRPNLRRKQQQQNSLSFYLVKWRSFWVGLVWIFTKKVDFDFHLYSYFQHKISWKIHIYRILSFLKNNSALVIYICSFLSSVQDRCVKWWLTRSDPQNRQVSSRYTTQLVVLWLEGRQTYANNKLTICTYNEEWQNWFLLNS